MGYIDIAKLLTAVVTPVGTIAIIIYNSNQSKKTRVELLEKLDDALTRNSKNASCEIFRLLYGLSMNFEDIKKLVEDSDVNKIIHTLRKTPGMVEYKNGKFGYTKLFKKAYTRMFDHIFSFSFTVFWFFLILLWSAGMVISKNFIISIIMFILMIIFSILFGFGLKNLRYNQMVENLINKT